MLSTGWNFIGITEELVNEMLTEELGFGIVANNCTVPSKDSSFFFQGGSDGGSWKVLSLDSYDVAEKIVGYTWAVKVGADCELVSPKFYIPIAPSLLSEGSEEPGISFKSTYLDDNPPGVG